MIMWQTAIFGLVTLVVLSKASIVYYQITVFVVYEFDPDTHPLYAFKKRHTPIGWKCFFYLIFIYRIFTVDGQKKEDDFQCPSATGTGNFADPATCRRFYQCVDGYPYMNRCPSGLFFDDISKFCTFKNEARCGPIASTPAPITEPPTDLAEKCNNEECQLPYCFCSKDGTVIPGNLEAENASNDTSAGKIPF
ncbi:hypothetical protein HUJ05_000526 [Dendroctonus ponderosae]|nr:hypothetical protein HUJ05_000526 [Dendroctonus ponderosae]